MSCCPTENGNISFNIKSNPCCPPTNVCAPLRQPCVPCPPCEPIKVCAPLRKPCLPCAPCLKVCAPMNEPCAPCPPCIPCPRICQPMAEPCPPCPPCSPSECCYTPMRRQVKGCKCPNKDGSCKKMKPKRCVVPIMQSRPISSCAQLNCGDCCDVRLIIWPEILRIKF